MNGRYYLLCYGFSFKDFRLPPILNSQKVFVSKETMHELQIHPVIYAGLHTPHPNKILNHRNI